MTFSEIETVLGSRPAGLQAIPCLVEQQPQQQSDDARNGWLPDSKRSRVNTRKRTSGLSQRLKSSRDQFMNRCRSPIGQRELAASGHCTRYRLHDRCRRHPKPVSTEQDRSPTRSGTKAIIGDDRVEVDRARAAQVTYLSSYLLDTCAMLFVADRNRHASTEKPRGLSEASYDGRHLRVSYIGVGNRRAAFQRDAMQHRRMRTCSTFLASLMSRCMMKLADTDSCHDDLVFQSCPVSAHGDPWIEFSSQPRASLDIASGDERPPFSIRRTRAMCEAIAC